MQTFDDDAVDRTAIARDDVAGIRASSEISRKEVTAHYFKCPTRPLYSHF